MSPTAQRCLDFDKKKNSVSEDFIDEHLFVEALALAAFEVVYRDPQPSEAEKIILLIERMNNSQGPKRVQMAHGITRFGQAGENVNDLTTILRQNYPHFFELPDECQ